MSRTSYPLVLVTLLSIAITGCSAAGGQGTDVPMTTERGRSIHNGSDALKGCKGKASSSIPSSGDYYLTTFGNGASDDGIMSCGQYTKHGSWYYAASRQRYGCGSHIRIEANGKCVVAETDDYGPDVCVENAAGMPIIDASPMVAEALFGVSSGGYSDALAIHVTKVDKSTPLGPCDASSQTDPPANDDPPSTGGSGGAAGSGSSGAAGSGSGCGSVTQEGTCQGDVLKYCDGDQVQTVDCASNGMTCGWNDASSYYDCTGSSSGTGGSGGSSGGGGSSGSGSSGCGSVTEAGECSGDTLSYCNGGSVVTENCSALGMSCGYDSQAGYYNCITSGSSGGSGGSGGSGSGCGSVTAEGECSGDTLSYCNAGELVTVDCQNCGWNSGAGYYDCI